MELLSKTIDAIKEVNWVLSLIASIPLSIAANLLTPKIANWWGRRSNTRALRRADKLKSQLERVRQCASDKEELGYRTTTTILKVLSLMALASALGGLGEITSPFAALGYLLAFVQVDKHLNLMSQCRDFAEFEKRTAGEIQKLEHSSR